MTFVMKTTLSLQLYVKIPSLFGCQIKKRKKLRQSKQK
jgi:hypothetical protein